MSNIDDIEPEVSPEVAHGSRKVAAVALLIVAVVFAVYLGAVAAVLL